MVGKARVQDHGTGYFHVTHDGNKKNIKKTKKNVFCEDMVLKARTLLRRARGNVRIRTSGG
jgi:hypothetical protein